MLRQVSRLKLADYVGGDGRNRDVRPVLRQDGRDGLDEQVLPARARLNTLLHPGPSGLRAIICTNQAEECWPLASCTVQGMLAAYELARHGKGRRRLFRVRQGRRDGPATRNAKITRTFARS